MKKSILRRMAEEVENRTEVPQPETNEPSVSLRRHSSPVISNVGKALTHLGEDTIVSIDPSKVERSPYQDRFDLDGEGEEELEALKQSIASEGQKIPVLVRPHPTRRDSYQLAYGHRRLNAVKALMAEAERPETVKIRAYVRDLTDRQLIEEQAVENGVRQNLTWIEQAMWAVQLKAAGLSNRAICPVLGLSEAAVSHLFRVTSAIPSDIILAIGRARTVGRPKWTALADLLKDSAKVEAVRAATREDGFRKADGVDRIALAMSAASGSAARSAEAGETVDFSHAGRHFGRMKRSATGTTVTIPKAEDSFASWLADRMPDLMREFEDQSRSG